MTEEDKFTFRYPLDFFLANCILYNKMYDLKYLQHREAVMNISAKWKRTLA